MKERIERLREVKQAASLGGGPDKIAKEHEKGKLSARERINLLLDPDGRIRASFEFVRGYALRG